MKEFSQLTPMPTRVGTAWRDARTPGGICAHFAGEGPPLVLLHGFGVSSYTWRHVVEPLGGRFCILAPDMLGGACSARPRDADYSMEAHLGRLEALLQEKGIAGAAVMGNSYGGTLAFLLAARSPYRVSRLILVAPAAFVDGFPLLIRVLRSRIFGPLAVKLPPLWAMRLAMRRAYADPARISPEAARRYAHDMDDPESRDALRATALGLPAMDPAKLEGILSRVRQPTLIIWGQQDRILPLPQGERLHRVLPGSRLRALEDCGHAPQEERPAEFLDAVLPFLAAHEPEDVGGSFR